MGIFKPTFPTNIYTDIEFYKYVDHTIIECEKSFNLPYDVLILTAERSDMVDPSIEPVGVYWYAGIFKCLWRDNTYNQIALNSNMLDLSMYDDKTQYAIKCYNSSNLAYNVGFTKAFYKAN